MRTDLPPPDTQAVILARHFVGQTPSRAIIRRYTHIVNRSPVITSEMDEERLLSFGFSHPAVLPMLDGGLALIRPGAELRRRIYIMFAILEATPEYSQRFLAQRRTPLYVVVIGIIGGRAILRAVGGILLVKALRV